MGVLTGLDTGACLGDFTLDYRVIYLRIAASAIY